MSTFLKYFNSSLGKKQIVASTGLFLILFVVAHLAGNLFIFGGPEVFNGYAKKLASFRPALTIAEFGLLGIFLIHLYTTVLLVIQNYQARGGRAYAAYQPVGQRSLATMLMPYTGTVIVAFVVWHLLDFTFVDHGGPLSILKDGTRAGLYGVVFNAFSNPWHSFGYILGVVAVGFHLAHGIQSFFQTFGFNHPRYTPGIKRISNLFSFLITILFCAIPIYIFLKSMCYLR